MDIFNFLFDGSHIGLLRNDMKLSTPLFDMEVIGHHYCDINQAEVTQNRQASESRHDVCTII